MIHPRQKNGAIPVPVAVLEALAKRRLTISEIMVVLAVCSQADISPGKAKTTVAVLARTMGVRKDSAASLIRHAIQKRILNATVSGEGSMVRIMTVNSPDEWAVPG